MPKILSLFLNMFKMPKEQKIKEDDLEMNIDPLVNEKVVYSIMSGADDNEYFSYALPILIEGKLLLSDYFMKGVFKEDVIDTVVEEYFCVKVPDEPIKEILLSEGILLKEYSGDSIFWKDNTLEMAQQKIKDKILLQYQRIVPQLLQRINAVEERANTQQDKKGLNRLQ